MPVTSPHAIYGTGGGYLECTFSMVWPSERTQYTDAVNITGKKQYNLISVVAGSTAITLPQSYKGQDPRVARMTLTSKQPSRLQLETYTTCKNGVLNSYPCRFLTTRHFRNAKETGTSQFSARFLASLLIASHLLANFSPVPSNIPSVAERLERQTCDSETPSSSPALAASWICSSTTLVKQQTSSPPTTWDS